MSCRAKAFAVKFLKLLFEFVDENGADFFLLFAYQSANIPNRFPARPVV
jgi:hypothetical protein